MEISNEYRTYLLDQIKRLIVAKQYQPKDAAIFLNVYVDVMKDIPSEYLEEAIDELVKKEGWFPQASEIWNTAKRIAKDSAYKYQVAV